MQKGTKENVNVGYEVGPEMLNILSKTSYLSRNKGFGHIHE